MIDQSNLDGFGYVIIFSSIERILIVLVAGMAMYLGYKLFQLSAQTESGLEGRYGSWHLRLSKVGPGVFFALFGAVVLVYSLAHRPSMGYPPPADSCEKTLPGPATKP